MTTSILERCVMIAIRDTHISERPNAQPIIDLIEGAHQSGYICKMKRSRYIDQAHEAERHQRRRLEQRRHILESGFERRHRC